MDYNRIAPEISFFFTESERRLEYRYSQSGCSIDWRLGGLATPILGAGMEAVVSLVSETMQETTSSVEGSTDDITHPLGALWAHLCKNLPPSNRHRRPASNRRKSRNMQREKIFEWLLTGKDQEDRMNEQDGREATDSGLVTLHGVRQDRMVAMDASRHGQPGRPSSMSAQASRYSFQSYVEAPQSQTRNEHSSVNSNKGVSPYTELTGWEQYGPQKRVQVSSSRVTDAPTRNTSMPSQSFSGHVNRHPQSVAHQDTSRSTTRSTPQTTWIKSEPSDPPLNAQHFYWVHENPANRSASNRPVADRGRDVKVPRQHAANTVIARPDGVASGSSSSSSIPRVPSSSMVPPNETVSWMRMTDECKVNTLAMLQSQRDRLRSRDGAGPGVCGYLAHGWRCTTALTYEHAMLAHFLPDARDWYMADFNQDRIRRADTIFPDPKTASVVAGYLFYCSAKGCDKVFTSRYALKEHNRERHRDVYTGERDTYKEGKVLLEFLVKVWEDELRGKRRN